LKSEKTIWNIFSITSERWPGPKRRGAPENCPPPLSRLSAGLLHKVNKVVPWLRFGRHFSYTSVQLLWQIFDTTASTSIDTLKAYYPFQGAVLRLHQIRFPLEIPSPDSPYSAPQNPILVRKGGRRDRKRKRKGRKGKVEKRGRRGGRE